MQVPNTATVPGLSFPAGLTPETVAPDGQPILHADADAFFASVEARDRPELLDVPFVVIAGLGEVVACPNYPARAYGIHGGMTLHQARRRCAELVTVPARAEPYRQASEELFALFARYAVAIEPGSMEEAFLDVGDRDPVDVGSRLRREVRAEIGLPLSVGVGRTKLVAKLASRRAKPDGLVVIAGDAEQQLRDELRIADVWGVGQVTRERLCDLGIHTVRDLDGLELPELAAVVGLAMARRLVSIAMGTDDAAVQAPKPGRLISGERTVTPTSRSATRVAEVLTAATDSAVERLDSRGQLASRLEVVVRYDDQQSVATRLALPVATDDADQIHRLALELLGRTGFSEDGRGVQRVGVVLTLYRGRQPYLDQPALF
ncbi:Y-family DNA polymerase [Nakamurella lactea]|uniref:Y-family DNA polymerase n=1 Tax=Nakamurella lactea TaxID=459515 RepID=UPI0003FF3C3E|nr:DNA polymerase IV [Nakamurella lactea]